MCIVKNALYEVGKIQKCQKNLRQMTKKSTYLQTSDKNPHTLKFYGTNSKTCICEARTRRGHISQGFAVLPNIRTNQHGAFVV